MSSRDQLIGLPPTSSPDGPGGALLDSLAGRLLGDGAGRLSRGAPANKPRVEGIPIVRWLDGDADPAPRGHHAHRLHHPNRLRVRTPRPPIALAMLTLGGHRSTLPGRR